MPLSTEDASWVQKYSKEVIDTFEPQFRDGHKRFIGWERLVKRFSGAIELLLTKDDAKFRAVDEAHNELCVASALLHNAEPKFTLLEYEPSLEKTKKSIDFRGMTDGDQTIYIDVKTIKPEPKDRWDQFEKATSEGWIPANIVVSLSEEWLGGELWHNMFTARGRMLEYTLELESKINEGKLTAENTYFVLAICGEGFHWHVSNLEDFVAFYFTGKHRGDDPFSLAELKWMEANNASLSKVIHRFACMNRPQGDIFPRRLNWNVQPPKLPTFGK